MARDAREVFATLTDAQQADHEAAFTRIRVLVESLAPPGAKVFEVHHSVNYARTLYQAEMARGMCAFDCERIVRKAYVPAESARVPFVDVSNITDADGVSRKLKSAVRVF